ncbi:MAG: ferritin-like domain-containing protein [Gemmatimonadetes bacterium]|nr:ferritin-like domain-containing protein [Gemmatimonadota bacterium]
MAIKAGRAGKADKANRAGKADRAGKAGKGRKELLEGLNEDLANEYTAIISYLLFSRLANGRGRMELSGFFEAEIADELEHAKYLSQKIVALGGTPTTKPAAVTLSQNNHEMLELSLKAEKDTITRYTARIQQAEAAGELALKVELENLVAEETRHKEDLERILIGWRD